MRIEALSGWTSEQRHVVAACFLGWTLDAFDFFLLVFVLKDIAQEFNTQITEVTFAILLTLAMRPVGAYLFGRAADRWGRRPTLMVNVLLYSFIEFASGFAPSLTVLLVLRAISALQWAENGASARHSPWSLYRRTPEALCRACCNRAIRPDTSWRRSSTACCSSTSDGAACSWLGSFRRFSFSNPPQCSGIA